jgi:hypothetical protein
MAAKTKHAPACGQFNCYPSTGAVGADAAGPAGSGLPYKIVATQHGVDPFDSLNTTTP